MTSNWPASRAFRVACFAVLAGLSFLPIGTWLNISFPRALSFQALGLGWGVLLVALLTVVLVIMFGRDDRVAAVYRPIYGLIRVWERRPVLAIGFVACAATATYVVTSWTLFNAKPLLIDELVQLIQARIFLAGRLWLPVDAHPEFRSVLHMVEQSGRWYGQFPPGGPAMLALGELFRAPWIVNPICGGVSVATFAMLLRWSGARPGVSLGATLAFGFAPFVVFQSGSHMNHVTSLTWLLIAAAALVRATRDGVDRPLAGFICGIALGAAATIRPLEAAAWALPAGAWLGWRAFTQQQWRAFILSGIGVALPMAAMMWVNYHTTGGPFTFGYTVLWGKSHGLGFHTSPWGESHTVLRGVALTAAYLHSLNEFLFEVPLPSLLPALAALLLARKSDALERYLLVSGGLVLGAYFAYWHDGFFLGPRFMFALVPLLALLVARLPGIVAEQWRHPLAVRSVACAYAATLLLGLTMVLPARVRLYAQGFQSERWDYDAIAEQGGARGGTILVRESWGAQVIDRLWALGVSHSFTEVLYRHVDTCGLDDMATRLEHEGVRGAAAEARLRPMMADSARITKSTMSPDETERVLPGSVYPPVCIERIKEDVAGYALFGPVLLARDTSTVWLRDLHASDTLVVPLANGRPVWLFRRGTGDNRWTPVLVRIDGDSLRTAWYGFSGRVGGVVPRK